MQARHLIVAFQIISLTILVGCKINTPTEEGLNPGIRQAKELVYINRLAEAEQVILTIDTNALDDINKGAWFLTNAFLQHELGNRALALSSMSRASELISSSDSDFLKAELSLINGFIFEQLILKSEALKSYFQAYEYFRDKTYSDKLFYALLGISRISQDGSEYLKLAEELLIQLNSNRFNVLYLNAKAAVISDVKERNRIILQSLNYFDEQHALKKQISIYCGIALNYQLLDQPDSSYYYLNIAQEIIEDNRLPPEQNFHFYIIKAYIEFSNQRDAQALETLEVLFNYASNEPGILSQAFLRRSLIMKDQGKFTEAYHDLKNYTRLLNEERAKADRYQLGLLSIQYQLQHKELQLARVRYHLLLTIVLASVLLMFAGWIFLKWKRRAEKKKKELESKYAKTSKLLDEQVVESIKEAQLGNIESEHGKFNGLKLQEFGAVFRIHHPLFREKLMKVHPEISQNDQKHCEFILGGLSVYQTIQILGVSVEAVKKARKKLRSKFGCPTIKELHRYLQEIDESF
jgi:hypothetical protein